MIIVAFILFVISGISKAIMDKVNFHFTESIFIKYNGLFWNPEISHQNKYKDGIKKRGPRFPGSTTVFVWTTDAWHLFGMIHRISLIIAVYLLALSAPWWALPIGYSVLTGTFELFFKAIFHDKGRNQTRD